MDQAVASKPPQVASTQPPQEALLLEAEIAKKKVKLGSLKQRTLEELEAADNLVATSEGRPPKVPKDLIKDEITAVESKRSDLELEIK